MIARRLSEASLLELWDWGRERHAVDRAAGSIVAGYGVPWEEVVAWPIGHRDGLLIDLYAESFGPRIDAAARCPRCGDETGMPVDCATIRLPTTPERPLIRIAGSTGPIVVRVPDSRLLAMAQDASVTAAREALLRACVVEPADPTAEELEAAARAIPEADPQSDLNFELTCVVCEAAWVSSFQVDRFFWAEVEARALRIVGEIARLAAAYHWSESDILAMSSSRRQAYLELCAHDGR